MSLSTWKSSQETNHLRETDVLVPVVWDQTCEKEALLEKPESDYGGGGACDGEWEVTKYDSEMRDP